jgi:hypothetical protein
LALGGIMGDAEHFAKGGYHVPRSYLLKHQPDDYSIQLPVDCMGDPDAASAIDLSPAFQEGQHLLTRRLLNATNADDARLLPVREWAGSLDSENVTARSLRPASLGIQDVSDQFSSDHLTHVHISIDRKWQDDDDVLAQLADLLSGIPVDGANTGSGDGMSFGSMVRSSQDSPPPFPLQHGYFGPIWGPRSSHGGFTEREKRSVRRIQRWLDELGFYHDEIDGIYGRHTIDAVSEWQRKTRPDVTTRFGEVWADDWRAMWNDVHESGPERL